MDFNTPPAREDSAYRLTCFVRVDQANALSPVSYYRGYLPAFYLGTAGSFDARILSQNNLRWMLERFGERADHALAADVFMISRLYRTEGLEEFQDKVRELGGISVFDTDDDLTEEFRELDGRGDEFIATLRKMDVVTVSTPYLAQRMAKYTDKRITVLPNHVDVRWFSQVSRMGQRIPRLENTITVGMLGTSSHYGDWHYPVEALKRIKQELEGQVTIIVGGFVPDYLDGLALSIRGCPYSQYPVMVRQFDIVLCSLNPKDEFNLSKSGVKALESMAAARPVGASLGGAVPVCTDMPVYRRVISHGKNGFLVKGEEWYDVIRALVVDQSKRERISRYGHKWVAKNRDMRTGWKRWASLLRSERRR